MSYGPHRHDRAWSQQEEETDNGDTNELIDTPLNEDGRLHQFVEDLLTGPEQEEPNAYLGTFYEDDGE